MEKKIIIIAGEPSGDLQAGLLVSCLKQLDNEIKIYAVGGGHLKEAGAEILRNIKDLSVLGLFDVLRKLGKFQELMSFIVDKINELKPQAIIFVDFSGFNLRLAKKINNKVKTIYYISPQVWASRQGRVKTIKRFINKMLVIFKFEQEFYRKFGIDAEFVGHPLLDIVKPSMAKEQALREFGLKENTPVFALLPGSRISEIKNILPIMLRAASIIKEKIPEAQFVLSKIAHIDGSLYQNILNNSIPDIKIIEGKPYDCLNVADFVLVASGTATLETAIMGKPNVVIYKMGLLNYLLYRPQVKVPFIGMENIVAGKMLAPEFIQFKAKPRLIAQAALELFNDKVRQEEIQEGFRELREKLGPPGAPARAAKSILNK